MTAAKRTRQRVNPHERGTPEWTIHERWRKALALVKLGEAEVEKLRKRIDMEQVEIDTQRARAVRYADALTALGHPPAGAQLQIPGPEGGAA